MTVPVQQYLPGKLRRLEIRSVTLQKFAEKECLAPELLGSQVPWKQVAQFVTEDRCAARLQHHDGHPGLNLRAENFHDSLKIFLGLLEQAEIVERASTAQMNARNADAESRRVQHLLRR